MIGLYNMKIVSTEKTKYMLLSRHQNVEQDHNITITNIHLKIRQSSDSFERQ
jgi:hypothetical protein